MSRLTPVEQVGMGRVPWRAIAGETGVTAAQAEVTAEQKALSDARAAMTAIAADRALVVRDE
jgi:hypothetical protein